MAAKTAFGSPLTIGNVLCGGHRELAALTGRIRRALAVLAAMLQPSSVYLIAAFLWVKATHADVPPERHALLHRGRHMYCPR